MNAARLLRAIRDELSPERSILSGNPAQVLKFRPGFAEPSTLQGEPGSPAEA
jgi:hypothetical protein